MASASPPGLFGQRAMGLSSRPATTRPAKAWLIPAADPLGRADCWCVRPREGARVRRR
jgi:hypothetical protein